VVEVGVGRFLGWVFGVWCFGGAERSAWGIVELSCWLLNGVSVIEGGARGAEGRSQTRGYSICVFPRSIPCFGETENSRRCGSGVHWPAHEYHQSKAVIAGLNYSMIREEDGRGLIFAGLNERERERR